MMRGCLQWTGKMAGRNKIERGLITFISSFFFFSHFSSSIKKEQSI